MTRVEMATQSVTHWKDAFELALLMFGGLMVAVVISYIIVWGIDGVMRIVRRKDNE